MSFNAISGKFSPTSDYFAYVGPDGVLKIWDTSSDNLKQEYTPSSHLSATCSCLSWCPCKHHVSPPKKKAKKSKSNCLEETIADLKLIAMGTLTGEVLLYSVVKGALHTKLCNGHTDIVNGISWLIEDNALFTCSNDRYIVKWSISEGTVTCKWKASKSAINSICVIDANNLLTASSAIFWWDINKQTVLKKFTGHASEVFELVPISITGNSNLLKYFVSAAIGDRVVNVWQLSDQSPDCNAIASFTLSDEPIGMDISQNTQKSQLIAVSVVTKEGVLHLFEHQLNGKLHKPLLPKSTVHIASMSKNSTTKSRPLAILSSKIEHQSTCLIAYGNFIRPVFEKLEFIDFKDDTFLIRENNVSSVVAVEKVSKVREPDRPSNATLLAPGFMTATKSYESQRKKNKRKTENESELPMEERLNAMYLDQAQSDNPDSPPNSESMVHLLLQGLQSNDNNLLQTVLRNSDEELIRITVKRLPLNTIPLLLKELHKRLTKRDVGNRPCLRWLKAVLSSHLSYLMSLQNIEEYIGPVSQLIDAREETYSKMAQLKGFLDILWFQIDAKAEAAVNPKAEPLVVYNDESSSEDEEENEMELGDTYSHDEELNSEVSKSESEDDVNSLSNESEND